MKRNNIIKFISLFFGMLFLLGCNEIGSLQKPKVETLSEEEMKQSIQNFLLPEEVTTDVTETKPQQSSENTDNVDETVETNNKQEKVSNYTYDEATNTYKISVSKIKFDEVDNFAKKYKSQMKLYNMKNNKLKKLVYPTGETLIFENKEYLEKHKIAFVIDDVGYFGPEIAEKYITMPELKFTFAVLPFVAHNKEGRKVLETQNYDMILHMPMESKNKGMTKRTPGILLTTDSKEDSYKKLDEAFGDIGGEVGGFNNHIGSVLTTNQNSMNNVIDYAKEKGKFFLDSNVMPNTVGYSTAKEKNVNTALNTYFVDNKNNKEYIKEYIKNAIELAKTRNETIVIGHYRPHTVEAFMEMKSYILESGVDIVTLNDLLERDDLVIFNDDTEKQAKN